MTRGTTTAGSKCLPVRLDLDFAYIDGLPKGVQLEATFYEYARHSPRVIDLVRTLEDAASKNDFTRVYQLLDDNDPALPRSLVLSIVGLDGFPEQPIKEFALLCLRNAPSQAIFGDDVFGCAQLAGAEKDGSAGPLDFEDWPGWPQRRDPKALFAISIPWHHTDAELTATVRRLLKVIRPRNQPQPKRAGRKGRAGRVQHTHLLHQLQAFRMQQQGLTFEDQKPPKTYLTREGWLKGAKMARERIERMGVSPFFTSERRTKFG